MEPTAVTCTLNAYHLDSWNTRPLLQLFKCELEHFESKIENLFMMCTGPKNKDDCNKGQISAFPPLNTLKLQQILNEQVCKSDLFSVVTLLVIVAH